MEKVEEVEDKGGEFKAVIFDLDGTLLDTESLSDEAMFRALEVCTCRCS